MSTTSISNCDITIKVLIVGDAGVGKSSLIWRMSENVFPSVEQANITINQTHKTKAIVLGKKQVVVKFIDTVGQERFRTISRSLYSNTDVVIIAYDPTTKSSFERLYQWKEEVERYSRNPKIFTALISTKSDIADNIQVPVNEAQEFAQEKGMAFMQTSSLNGQNVEELLYMVLRGAGEKLYPEENWVKFKPKPQPRSPTLLGPNSSNTSSPSSSSSNNEKKTSLCTIL